MLTREMVVSIVKQAIESVLPERAVKEALTAVPIDAEGDVILISIGKAAWRMANAAHDLLGSRISRGCVITKDGHSMGSIGSLEIFEAAHPVLEQRNLDATERAGGRPSLNCRSKV